ncbi:MAG TPA: DUF2092 domain-containing protein [Acetobacteraceae bacterium]|nr:DUF2092 domain-containing protein [Acetobacteraceae bacterium]
MHRGAIFAVSLMIPALLLRHGAVAQNSPVTPGTTSPPADSGSPAVDVLLQQMGAYLGSAQQFTFHADITFDHVLPSGQKLQYEAAEDVALRRPDGVYVAWSGDLGDRQFWYDGKTVTLYDPATSFYGAEAAPGTIDAMLEMVVKQLGFAPPLADFLYTDPYHAVRGNVQFSLDLGVTDVDGRECQAFAFVEKDIDWQVWIDTGPQLTPCKLVITYKTQPSQPQFSAVFTGWDFSPRIAAPVFTPDLPPGVEKIPFAPVVASASRQ